MKPQKIYAEVLEDRALEQFESAMNSEHTVKGALMPDAHTGYTLPIGAVIATDGFVFPSYVGYDIGCGMCAIKTTFKCDEVINNSEQIMNQLYEDLPVGFSKHCKDQEFDSDPHDLTDAGYEIFKAKDALKQLGTLGGGNHFLEIGKDENNTVWIITHSGSRGFGHGIAQHYMKLASPTGKASEGHFGFDVNTKEGSDYIRDLNWALVFALANRRMIIQIVFKSISKHIDGDIDWESLINRNHNHAELKDGLWIHRKGATHAEKGMMGVIPGNMRDGSFIVEGKGNPDSLYSSSHGAGRVLGRKKAKETLDYDEFVKTMDGITAKKTKNLLDESPMAYKNIFEVMELQKDLVDIKHHVKPIINVKG